MDDLDILETSSSYNVRLSNEALKKMAQKEEPRFLSILLRNKDCLMDAVSFGIKSGNEGHFWDSDARMMYNLILEYYKKYNNVLTRTAVDSIMESLSKVGGVTVDEEHRAKTRMYWDKIHGMEAPIEDYELLRDNLNNRFVQWQAYEIIKDELEKIIRATNNQNEIVRKARERLFKIDNLDADSYTLTMGTDDGIQKAMDVVTHRRDHPEETTSLLTGLNSMDTIYHGFVPGSYTIITGMVNGGKTTLMFNLAFNMARAGYNVVYVSLEKEAIPLFTRLLALHALVDYNRIKIGGKNEKGLSDYYYSKLIEAGKDLRENIKPRFECIQAAQGTKLSKLISEVEKVKNGMKIDALFVDYLGVIGAESHHPTRPDLDEAFTSQRLQAYGRINRFVTFTASQLKTPSAKEIRHKSRKATADDASKVEVNTEDLAGSKMIIADADNALGVILNSDSPPTKMFVYGTKSRDDESRRTIVLDFDGKIGRVSDPILEPGQVTDIDKLVYNPEITEKKLESDDGLFCPNTDEDNDSKESEINEKKDEDLKDEDFNFTESKSSPNDIKTTDDPQPKNGKDDDFDFLK